MLWLGPLRPQLQRLWQQLVGCCRHMTRAARRSAPVTRVLGHAGTAAEGEPLQMDEDVDPHEEARRPAIELAVEGTEMDEATSLTDSA